MKSVQRVVDRLPDTFYTAFTDPRLASHARVSEAWAVARGLRFATKNPRNDLPTWYVVETMGKESYPVLTLQPCRERPNAAGRVQVQGVPDVPLHRMRGPFMQVRANREVLARRLHEVLPQDRAYDPTWPDRYWSFTWEKLREAGKIGALLDALDWTVNESRRHY